MGSGGSVPGGSGVATAPTKGKGTARGEITTKAWNLAGGEALEDGVGRVVAIEKSLSAASKDTEPQEYGANFGWFVESVQYPDQWEAYNTESTQRLEQAFLAQEDSCSVVHNKRGYVVDLPQMVQVAAAGQAVRKVKRAACATTVDPKTGTETRCLIPAAVTDPFEEEEDISGFADFPGTVSTTTVGIPISLQSGFPVLKRSTYPLNGSIFNLTISPASTTSGMIVVTGGRKGQVRGWNATTSKIVADYTINGAPTILNVNYSPNGALLAVGVDDFTAYLFRERQSTAAYQLRGHSGKVYGLGFTACGTTLVTGSMDSTIRLWDVESGSCKGGKSVQTSHIFCLKCSKTQPSLAISVGNDALLTVHDFRAPSMVAMRCAGHQTTLWYADINAFDSQFASCGKDGTVRLWDARNPSKALFVLRSHARAVHCVEYTSSGTQILSSSKDGNVVCTNTQTGEGIWQAKAHTSAIFRVSYEPKQQKLLTCSSSGCVNIWDWNGL